MWLLVIMLGVFAVSLAYYLPSGTSDPWTALNIAGATAAIFCFILLAATLRTPFPFRTRLLTWIGVFVIGSALAISWTVVENQSRYQAATLSTIRERISRGVVAHEISTPLLSALQAYYSQKGKPRNTLGQIFRRSNPDAAVGKNIHTPSFEGDKLIITVASLAHHEILLVAEEGSVRGSKSDFKNLSGGTGMMQERARLTVNGVVYESEN